MKDKLDKEVAFMERMEKKLELNLKKKKSQLQLTLEVNNRFKDDLKKVNLFLFRENGFINIWIDSKNLIKKKLF